jgi:hypothetical protein
MQLSEHFTLAELTKTNTGLDNEPNNEAVMNLKRLVTTVLEPLRLHIGKPIIVNSGYRSQAVNAKVGGSRTSSHLNGLAADIRIEGMTAAELAVAIAHTGLPYDKAINEHGWVHIQVAPLGMKPRSELYTAVFTEGKPTIYLKGIV